MEPSNDGSRPQIREGKAAPHRGLLFVPIRSRHVRDEIVRQIEELMAAGRLRPGDILPSERELSKQLSASRPAVREALSALQHVGLVAFRSSGIRHIQEASPTRAEWIATSLAQHLATRRDVALEPLEVRGLIEPGTARLAAARARNAPALLAEMAAILQEQDLLIKRGEPAVEQDIRFHTLIASASGNSLIEKIVGVMNEGMRDWKRKTLAVEYAGAEAGREHWGLWEAIARGDEESSYDLAAYHIHSSQERILRYLSSRKMDDRMVLPEEGSSPISGVRKRKVQHA